MARILSAAVMAAVIGAAVASYVFISRPWHANRLHDQFYEAHGAGNYQKQRRAFTARLAAQAEVGRVWFIGHSHIEGLDVTQVDPRGLNLGIGGETMAFTQARLADYPGLAFASAVVLAVGGNDVADVPASVMRANARAIMDAIPADVPVVWSLILPTDEKLQPSMTRARIAAANAGWLDICAGRRRCLISDATPVLADNAGQLHTSDHIGDGEHLNETGYAKWRAVLMRDLKRIQGR